jgi:hypothetical protein
MISKGLFNITGICPLEYIGQQPECVEFVLNRLKEKGILYKQTIDHLE